MRRLQYHLHLKPSDLDQLLDQTQQFCQLTQPLYKQFGINGVAYLHFYANGDVLHFGATRDCQERVYQQYLNHHDHFSLLQLIGEPNGLQYQRDIISNPYQSNLYDVLAEFDLTHRLRCVDKIKTADGEALRIVVYSAPRHRVDVENFYLNYLDLIQNINQYFTDYVNDNAQQLLRMKSDDNDAKLLKQHFVARDPFQENVKTFVNQHEVHFPKCKQLATLKLSPREKDIIEWYILGKSTAETAEILKISHHTVRTHFDRLKKKLKVYYKSHILLKLIDAGVISPLDWKDIYK